jgi:DHA1 family multidrug resistance protein-like MFS transporter
MSEQMVVSPQSPPKLQKGLYMAAVFLFWMALYLYIPTLPVYAQTKSDDLAVIGVVLAMYGLWQAVVRLPLGIAADWLGRRKPFIVAGFILAALGAWILGQAGDVADLIIGRSITGLGASTWVALVPAFSALFPPKEAVKATATLTLVGSVSRMLSTGLTGSLSAAGGYSLPFFLAAGAAAAAILVVLPASERKRSSKRPKATEVRKLVSRRDVLLPALLNAVGQYAAWTATFSFFPILASSLGASDVNLSVLVSMNIGLVLAGNLLTATLVSRLGTRRLLLSGFILLAIGLSLAALASSLIHVFAAQFCMGLASGIGYPVMMGLSIEQVDDSQRTTAMGLHQAVYAVGMFAGPWLSGLLANGIGLQAMFGVTAAACLFAGLIGTRLLSQAHSESSQDDHERPLWERPGSAPSSSDR